MVDRNHKRENYAKKLCSFNHLFGSTGFDIDLYSAEIIDLFREFDATSSVHLEHANMLEYASTKATNNPDEMRYGFKIKGQEAIFVSSILSLLENIEIPIKLKDRFPDLTQEELNAALNLATFTFLAFERVINTKNDIF